MPGRLPPDRDRRARPRRPARRAVAGEGRHDDELRARACRSCSARSTRPGEALPDWEIFARVGRALGHRRRVRLAIGRRGLRRSSRRRPRAGCATRPGSRHERLRREGALQWPCPRAAPRARTTTARRGSTASRRLPDAERAARGWRRRRTPRPPTRPTPTSRCVLTTGRRRGPVAHDDPHRQVAASCSAAEPEPFVELHPDDAERAGVARRRARCGSSRGAGARRCARGSVDAVPRGRRVRAVPLGRAAPRRRAPAPLNGVVEPGARPGLAAGRAEGDAPCASSRCARDARARPRRRAAALARRRRRAWPGMATVEALLAHGAPGWDVTIVGAEPDAALQPRSCCRRRSPGERRRGRARAARAPAGSASAGSSCAAAVRSARLDLDERARVELADGASARRTTASSSPPARGRALPPIAGPRARAASTRSARCADVARDPGGAARAARRAVVIGGGLLGLEAARGLQRAGVRVTVVHLADRLMEQQLDALGARRCSSGALRELRDRGAARGARPTEIAGDGTRRGACGSPTATSSTADLVVVATGIRPDVELARAAGSRSARGDRGRRRAAHERARRAGRSASAPSTAGVVYGLWAPLLEQARAAGAVDAGRPGGVPRRRARDDAEGRGRRPVLRGRAQPRDGEEEVLALDTRRGRYRKLVLARRAAARARSCSATSARRRAAAAGRGRHGAVPAGAARSATGPRRVRAVERDGLLVRGRDARADRAGDRAGGLERVAQVAEATGATTGCGGCRTAGRADPRRAPTRVAARRTGGARRVGRF